MTNQAKTDTPVEPVEAVEAVEAFNAEVENGTVEAYKASDRRIRDLSAARVSIAQTRRILANLAILVKTDIWDEVDEAVKTAIKAELDK